MSVKCAERPNILSDAIYPCLFSIYSNEKVSELAIMVIPVSYSLTSSAFSTDKPSGSVTILQGTFSTQCIVETFPRVIGHPWIELSAEWMCTAVAICVNLPAMVHEFTLSGVTSFASNAEVQAHMQMQYCNTFCTPKAYS